MNTTFNFWVNNRANARGAYDIYIRITQDRKHKLLKTGISVPTREAFNMKAKQENWIRGRGGDTKLSNESLARQLKSLKSDKDSLSLRTKNPSKESIVNRFKGESSTDFMMFLNRIIKRFAESGAYRTSKRYQQLYNKLKDFENDVIPFDSITVTFLKNFESYMSGLHQNTRYEHFKNMRASFNQAIQEDIIERSQNPFDKFKVRQIPTNKVKLTVAEIKSIESLQLEKDSSLNHTRNCFLFAFYCGGIRAGDLITMRWANVAEGKLLYVMSKNRNSKLTNRNIPLIPEAKAILKQYAREGAKPEDFIFQELDDKLSKYISNEKKILTGHEKSIYNKIASRNTIFNKNLKKIAEKAGIAKPVTFHISRHSWAQYALDGDMKPKMMQAILGHEKFATTEIYITSLDDKKVEEAMLKLFS